MLTNVCELTNVYQQLINVFELTNVGLINVYELTNVDQLLIKLTSS